MSNKNNSPVRVVKGAAGLEAAQKQLTKQGFKMLLPINVGAGNPKAKDDWHEIISSQLTGSKADGRRERNDAPTLFASSGSEVPTTENIGTKGLGYIEWGAGNRWPNIVSLLTMILPYTAAGWKFNTDLLAGLGPVPMYRYSQYIGGNIAQKLIPYADAGIYLRGLMTDKQREIANIEIPGAAAPVEKQELLKILKEELEQLKSEYKKWDETQNGVKGQEQYSLKAFLERSNLAPIFTALAGDINLMGLAWPELQLNETEMRNGKPVASAQWNPKIVAVNNRLVSTCRFERMDDKGRINYVYVSNQWLDPSLVDKQDGGKNSILAYPCLSPKSPTEDLRSIIREVRRTNSKQRPTHFIMPSVYPTPGKPYYPAVPWHSIFGGKIYEYISTIISDRVTRKANSNIIGRVIYVSQEYMQSLFTQAGVFGDTKKQDEISAKVYEQINTWMADPNNSGQSLLAFTFIGADGKEHKSFEIVEIAAADSDSASANEKETAEVASIIFMAMGLDAALLGSSPLTIAASSGGTDLRERLEIRKSQMAPTENIMLSVLNTVRDFNEWDSHLVWQIKRYTLTTLDNSKTGVVESVTE